MRPHFAVLLFLCACGQKTEPGVTVLVAEPEAALAAQSLEFTGATADQLRHTVSKDPETEASGRGGYVISLVPRTDCTECYRLEGDGKKIVVHGGAPLGLQYGLAHALELFGYGFFHPWKTRVPAEPHEADLAALGKENAPEVDVRRGLHLHTLHPIEPYYDFWESGEQNLEGAKRTIDFLVKNRGNYIQWCALDDIINKGVDNHAHLKAITDYAHGRGVKVGIAIQLFGKSNLQNAFDLIDEDPDLGAEMRRRLHVLLDGIGFDNLNLSFGEFFGADPALFVQRVDEAYAAAQEVAPGIEMSGTIHLGAQDDLKVTYMGETFIYYFLVKFAQSPIKPWVHSVMFYDLYEDAGGAYFHDEFTEHREFLEAKLKAGAPVGYFPESAYWIAFDNSVPIYLPLYMRSRWLDLNRMKAAGPLRDHVLFSSGWEWGYWQTDAATLRMTYSLPSSWDQPVRGFFGEPLGDLIARLGEVQHDGLLLKRLAAYQAGRDQIIDAGKTLGIVSQPDRIQFDEVAAMNQAQRADFLSRILIPLKDYADQVTALDDELRGKALGSSDPFVAEMNDAFEITARRARFAYLVNKAAFDMDATQITKAVAELEAAKLVTSRRRKAMWDPDVKSITRNTPNATFYQYGYLREADTLCFWERERVQVQRVVSGSTEAVPGCIL